MKYSFLNDYSEGAHESIIAAMAASNLVQTVGYGTDEFCDRARARIAAEVKRPDSCIHFLVGGTQVNLTAAAALLRPHQGMISAENGHVSVHESGAIEATGHKVLTIPTPDGKLTAKAVEALIKAHYDDPTAEHMVQPGMVYVSQPTELGTVYRKQELVDLSAVCQKYHIPLYLDGARLGCALTCRGNDLTLPDIAALTDLFYIGGTKMGALFGEALVINRPELNTDFRSIIKQRGGMLAKGRLLGIQFETLFTDGLYYKLAQHAIDMAEKLAGGIAALGYSFAAEAVTNQLFPILPKAVLVRLEEDFIFSVQGAYSDTHDVIRLCTSWATDPDMVEKFLQKLKAYTV
ncbi:MAG TPA: aminotransferase class I/II-fold pyridoxal phosphate-dependent enzyme [Clostridia bacterium]|nr:aminotransferase class I/II-fold pyridoxal phosphate-dependent enzyme [Clostridia bacterium]